MIITALQGGLGNQMFQYAFGLATAWKNKQVLKIDSQPLATGVPPRQFELNIFGITGPISSKEENQRLVPVINLLTKASPKLTKIVSLLTPTYINEKYYRGTIPKVVGSLYLDGYWQSEDLFKDFEDKIREKFSFKIKKTAYVKKYLPLITSCESVSLHVRRTDYVNRNGRAAIVGCSLKYYHSAMKHIVSRTKKTPTFFVFSDDIGWCRQHIKFPKLKTYYLSSNKQEDRNVDMFLMSRCRHNIVANSSFSWWGAWLNTNRSKIVVAPEPWFELPTNRHHPVAPASWIKIPKK